MCDCQLYILSHLHCFFPIISLRPHWLPAITAVSIASPSSAISTKPIRHLHLTAITATTTAIWATTTTKQIHYTIIDIRLDFKLGKHEMYWYKNYYRTMIVPRGVLAAALTVYSMSPNIFGVPHRWSRLETASIAYLNVPSKAFYLQLKS